VDPDILWHSLGGGAIIAAALALARLLLDYGMRGGERGIEHADLRHRHQRDAEARLERILQDRLADADRRLERFEQEAYAERMRAASLEHEHARVLHAYELLQDQYADLQAEYTRLARKRLPAGR
jgi:predicted nuclease with TOPRIM domain